MAHSSPPTTPGGIPLAARPTVYKGTQMRSRLEARFAQWMDFHQWEWVYEPECFASADGQYLPDFELLAPRLTFRQNTEVFDLPESVRVFLEVKPTVEKHAEVHHRNWKIIEASTWSLLLGVGHAHPEGVNAVYIEGRQESDPGGCVPLLTGDGGWPILPRLLASSDIDELVRRLRQTPDEWVWNPDADATGALEGEPF